MKFIRPFLVLFLLALPVLGICQPGDPGGDPDVPITGIELLLGGGILLGIRKIYFQIKSKKE